MTFLAAVSEPREDKLTYFAAQSVHSDNQHVRGTHPLHGLMTQNVAIRKSENVVKKHKGGIQLSRVESLVDHRSVVDLHLRLGRQLGEKQSNSTDMTLHA
jgi:hypothetical protein